jgi:hypothetical protein
MTDDFSIPAGTPVDDDDDLFEAASETFPAKEDLKDRLVAIYPTGVSGERQGSNGKPYTWFETTTVVLDDGPDGWQAQVQDSDGEMRDNLVDSVAEHGPQVLRNFQWSTDGLVARLKPIYQDPKVRSQVGRINKRPSQKKGHNAAWSISKPTDADMATARQHAEVCKAERQAIRDARQAKADADAF